MKKTMLLLLFSVVFLLSGCVFDQEEIDKENPVVDTINPETTVEQLLEDIYTNPEYCKWAKEDTSFYQSCVDKTLEMFPEHFDDYHTDFIDEMIELNKEYTVIYENQELNSLFTVKITFVKTDDGIVVDTLGYRLTDLIDYEVLYQKRLNELLDSSVSVLEYCGGNDDVLEVCETLKFKATSSETVIYVINVHQKLDDNRFLFQVDLMDGETLIYSFNEYVTLVHENDEYKFDFEDITSNSITYSKEELEELFLEFLDEVRSDDFIEENFTVSENGNISFIKLLHNASSVTINRVSEYENAVMIFLEVEQNFETSYFTVVVDYDNESNNSYYLTINNIVNQKIYDQVYVKEFVDLFNEEMDDDTLETFFTEGLVPSELKEANQSDDTITSYTLEEYDNDYIFTYTINDVKYSYLLSVTKESNYTKMSFEDYDYKREENLMNDFFNIVSVSVSNACSYYVSSESVEYCEAQFANYELVNFEMMTVIDLSHYYKVIAKANTYPEVIDFDLDFIVVHEDDRYKIHFVNTIFEKEDLIDYFKEIESVINQSGTKDDVMDNYFTEDSKTVLIDLVNDLKDGNLLEFVIINHEFENTYVIFDVLDEYGISYSVYIPFTLTEDEKIDVTNYQVITLVDREDESTLSDYMVQFSSDYNNSSLSSEEFCKKYDLLLDKCMSNRDRFMTEGFNIVPDSIEVNSDGSILFTYDLVENEVSSGKYIINAVITLNEDGSYGNYNLYKNFFDLLPMDTGLDYEVLYTDIKEFLIDVTNESITDDELKTLYQNFCNVESFIDERELFDLTVLEVGYESDNQISFYVDYMDNDEIEFRVYYKLRLLSNNFVIISVDESKIENSYQQVTAQEMKDELNSITPLSNQVRELKVFDNQVTLYDFLLNNNYSVKDSTLNNNDYHLTIIDEFGNDLYDINIEYLPLVNLVGTLEHVYEEMYSTMIMGSDMEIFIDGIVYQLNSNQLSWSEFNEIIPCLSYLPDTYFTTVDFVTSRLIDEDFINNSITVEFEFVMGSSSIFVSYEGVPSISIDGVLFEFTPVGYYVPIEHSEPLASEEMTKDIIISYFEDIYNPEITNEEICNTYFNGMYPASIISDRNTVFSLELQIEFTYVSLTPHTNDLGNVSYYTVIFDITTDLYGTGTINIDIIVYALENGNYVVEIL